MEEDRKGGCVGREDEDFGCSAVEGLGRCEGNVLARLVQGRLGCGCDLAVPSLAPFFNWR